MKSDLTPRDKDKWSKVMKSELMSSEESDGDDECIIVKRLKWREEKVTSFFHKLDEACQGKKTPQATRQRRNRIISTTYSERASPKQLGIPEWVIRKH